METTVEKLIWERQSNKALLIALKEANDEVTLLKSALLEIKELIQNENLSAHKYVVLQEKCLEMKKHQRRRDISIRDLRREVTSLLGQIINLKEKYER